jgi:hypothetical protein
MSSGDNAVNRKIRVGAAVSPCLVHSMLILDDEDCAFLLGRDVNTPK